MSLSKVDQAITVIEYQMKDRMRRVKMLEKKLDLSEEEKIRIGKEYDFFRSVNTLITEFKKSINAHLGRIPPQDTDIERGVLGAVMLHSLDSFSGRKGIDEVKSFLKPDQIP